MAIEIANYMAVNFAVEKTRWIHDNGIPKQFVLTR